MQSNNQPSEELIHIMQIINFAPVQDGSFSSVHFRFELKYLDATGGAFSEFGEYDEELVKCLVDEVYFDIRNHVAENFPKLLTYIDKEAAYQKELNVWDDEDDKESFLYVWDQYIAMRNKFLGVRKAAFQFIKENRNLGTWKEFRSFQSRRLELQFEILDDFSIKIRGDIVDRAFNGMDIRRIRVCRYCRLLFWAYRLDNFTCSKKCGQNERTRKFREKQNNRFQSRRKNNGTL